MQALAPIRRFRARRELVAARRAADAELVATRLPSPRLAWRTNELCSIEHRRELAAGILDAVRAADARLLPGASPVDRVGVRGQLPALLHLAAVLADDDQPVQPRGVLLVERLLADEHGPLYGANGPSALGTAAAAAVRGLEGER